MLPAESCTKRSRNFGQGKAEMDAHGTDMPVDPQTACDALIQCYSVGAGAEALLRAFISERNCEPFRAQFWVGVYRLIARQSALAQRPPHTSRV